MTAVAGVPVDFALPWRWLLAYAVALARPTAMLALNPVFTRVQIAGVIRGAVGTALALPMVPVLANQALDGRAALDLLLLTGKEALIGAALGLLLGAPFWALDVAGDVLDAQRGATQGRLNDPAGFEDVSVSGTMLMLGGVLVFAASGGLELIADLLYGSWAIWRPLGALPSPDARTPGLLLGVLDGITRQGLLLAVPAVIAMLLTDGGLMLVARIAPSLRIDDLALAARNIVFFAVMPLYALYLVAAMRHEFSGLPTMLDVLRAMTVGAP